MPSPNQAAGNARTPHSGFSAPEQYSGEAPFLPDGSPRDAGEESCDERCWVVLGDIHGEKGRIRDIPELPDATGVIITGDLTKTGGVPQAKAIVDAFQDFTPVVLAQIGNQDRPEVNVWLNEQGINLHCKVRELAPDIAIMGIGGSTFTPFGTPSEFPEARFAEWLEELAEVASGYKKLVLVSHMPPFDTVCDRLAVGGHGGSRAVREFIEERQPAVCLCGHIHESYGEQLMGRTIVMNPGPFAAGGYITMRLGEKIRVNLHKLEF